MMKTLMESVSLELRISIQNSLRQYTTTTPRLVVSRARKPEESPSPLSPLSRMKFPVKKTKNVTTKPSKSVTGTLPTRKRMVAPAVERESRVPVWARPPKEIETIKPPVAETWGEHRAAIKAKYPERWNPTKKVSREAMDAIRQLHKQDAETYPSWVLAQRFMISPEAVKRILKSNFRMSEGKVEEKVMKERKRRIERMKTMREEEMHQMVRAGIQLKVHPDDQLRLK